VSNGNGEDVTGFDESCTLGAFVNSKYNFDASVERMRRVLSGVSIPTGCRHEPDDGVLT